MHFRPTVPLEDNPGIAIVTPIYVPAPGLLHKLNEGNVSGANQIFCANPCKPTKKVSKNSKKNHECASQLTSSIYKILWSNSSYYKSYKKD